MLDRHICPGATRWWPLAAGGLLLVGCGIDLTVFSNSGAGAGGTDPTTTVTTTVGVGGSGQSVTVTGTGGFGGEPSVGGANPVGAGGSMGEGGSTSTGMGGMKPTDQSGCADGTREFFLQTQTHPNIAGCAGGFQVSGITTGPSFNPQCNRQAGNDSMNPIGTGCSVEDLCAAGWHVCESSGEVATKSGTGQCDVTLTPNEFWLTRQIQNSQGSCIPSGDDNNLTGCGSFGNNAAQSCAPLTRSLRWIECGQVTGWSCGGQADNLGEAAVVTKGVGNGGVICCKND